jgi:hypothetical protein
VLDEFGLQNQFIGYLSNGKIDIQQLEAYHYYCENTPDSLLQITVDRVTRVRTENQNKYYWGVVVKYMSYITGYTSKECHDILVKEALEPKFEFIDGIVIEKPKSTSGLNTYEFFQFVESARLFVMYQFGVTIPLPNDP